MTSSLASSQSAAAPAETAWRSGWFSRFFAFTPLWLRIFGFFAWQTYFPGMYSRMAETSGPPPGDLLEGLVMAWMLVGAYVLWRARSRLVAAGVYLIFTIPATLAVTLGPAIVLILLDAS
jgi:hypothetical protein